MRTYVERAEDFIKELLEYKGELTFKREYEVRRIVREYSEAHPRRHIYVSAGAARTAIITSDYVIKIDTGNIKMFGGRKEEVKFYKLAESEGMEYLLAKPTRFRFQKINFYIYPRATVCANMRKRKNWRAHLTDEEMVFVDQIDDLHEGNVGFLHGKPCIIDYAMNSLW